MKAIEFIKDYEAYLSLRGIEKGLGIPIGTLRRSILEGRIPDKHEKKIVDKFTFLTRDPLSAESVDKKPVVAKEKATTRVAKKVGDKLNPIDGTWVKTLSGKYIKNGVKVDPIEKGGKIYYKVE